MNNNFTPENKTKLEQVQLFPNIAIKYEAHPLESLVDSVEEMLKLSKESKKAVTTDWHDYQIIVYPDNTVENIIEQYVDKYMADNLDFVIASKMTREDMIKTCMTSDSLSKDAIVNKNSEKE